MHLFIEFETGLQNAEDAAYLVKYLLNGTTGTPMKDMLRTVTRTFRSKPVDKKTVSVSQPLSVHDPDFGSSAHHRAFSQGC